MYILSSHLIVLFIYIYITWFYVDFNITIKLFHLFHSYQLTNLKKRANKDFIKI